MNLIAVTTWHQGGPDTTPASLLAAASHSLFSVAALVYPLAACALEIDADVLMPALNRSLDAMKQPAARVSVMEFVVLFMGVGRVAGLPSNATHVR